MIDALVARVPIDDWWTVLAILGAAVCVAAGIAIGVFGFNTVTVTKTVKVERSWGKADQVIPGAAVNPQLAGLRCSIYEKRKTIVCAP